jgi:hypothetical protein
LGGPLRPAASLLLPTRPSQLCIHHDPLHSFRVIALALAVVSPQGGHELR